MRGVLNSPSVSPDTVGNSIAPAKWKHGSFISRRGLTDVDVAYPYL